MNKCSKCSAFSLTEICPQCGGRARRRAIVAVSAIGGVAAFTILPGCAYGLPAGYDDGPSRTFADASVVRDASKSSSSGASTSSSGSSSSSSSGSSGRVDSGADDAGWMDATRDATGIADGGDDASDASQDASSDASDGNP
jgi:hypothetical protein